jgi:multidrug efflux pump subunit AcrA (membrane-fusion protein)
MNLTAAILASMLALGGPDEAAGKKSPSVDPTLSHCVITLIQEANVPARQAGVLAWIEGRPGMEVQAGAPLAQVDDREAKSQRKVAEFAFRSAELKATNDVNIRYAQASENVAREEYVQAVEANRKVPGAVTLTEVNRLKFSYDRAKYQQEQASMDFQIAGIDAQGAQAQFEAHELNVSLRRIEAPFDGIVVQVHRHAGEWVGPGDPVMRLVRMNRLRVEGFVNAADFTPDDVSERPVTVAVRLPRGRVEQFESTLSFVSPVVEASGEFRVWADIDNRKESGQWVLRPGLTAEMTVRVGAAPAKRLAAESAD